MRESLVFPLRNRKLNIMTPDDRTNNQHERMALASEKGASSELTALPLYAMVLI